MKSPFLSLSRPGLENLASALETGRLNFPIHPLALDAYLPSSLGPAIAAELNRLRQEGMAAQHMAYMLRLMAQERASAQERQDQISLVWTGPEVPGAESRDTRIVVQKLFRSAQQSVLIASYALDTGPKGRSLFQPLADQMDTNPGLSVRMFLNIQRPYQSQTPASELLKEFAHKFRTELWPGKRLPEVFHDPRALEITNHSRSCLHAKCVVVDEESLLITSANFTEAAHARNIEAGILMTDTVIARNVRSQFERLVAIGALCSVQGL